MTRRSRPARAHVLCQRLHKKQIFYEVVYTLEGEDEGLLNGGERRKEKTLVHWHALAYEIHRRRLRDTGVILEEVENVKVCYTLDSGEEHTLIEIW